MSNADDVVRRLADQTSTRSETGVLVRMEGRLAVVNIGSSTVTIPCVGFYPPVVGMAVRVDWVNGAPAVTAPTKPLNPIGKISGTGTPRATATVDGVPYLLYYRSGYTPAVGHDVEINWATGVIQGQITGVNTPTGPGENTGGATAFEVVVRAGNSGRYQSGSGWWGKDPWASSSNNGIWTYENRAKEAVGTGAVTKAEVYLPLLEERGLASIGTHDYGSIPTGAPAINSATAMGAGAGRSGWITLPAAFGPYLAGGHRGIGVTAPGGGGYNRWRGVDTDGLSGALRFTGTR